MQSNTDLVQLRLAHDAGKPKQETVVIGARIIKPLAVGDDHAEQRTQLKKLVPITIITSQSRSVETDHQPRIAEADLSDQLLKSLPIRMPRARLAKILVNDMDPFTGPAEINSAIHQSILKLGALLVMLDLGHRRLANVDVSQLGATSRRQPLVSGCYRQHHCPPPRRSPPSA